MHPAAVLTPPADAAPDGRRVRRPLPHRPVFLAVPAVLFVLVVFVLPCAWVVRVAAAGPADAGSGTFFDLDVFAPSNLLTVLRDDLFRTVLGVTLRLGAVITVICLVVAVPFAAYLHLARGWRKRALLLTVVFPKLVNLLILLYGVMLILGSDGFLNQALRAAGITDQPLPMFANLFAVVFTEVYVVLPYPVLILTAAFHAADPRHYDAARSLGAGPLRAYLETVVRPAFPAVVGAALVSAVWGVGAFVGPLVMGNPRYYTLSVEVYERALNRLEWVDAAGWAVLGVLVFAALTGSAALLARRRGSRW
ncbi:MAG TPA: ABC transporter permease [Micromonospora sp.]